MKRKILTIVGIRWILKLLLWSSGDPVTIALAKNDPLGSKKFNILIAVTFNTFNYLIGFSLIGCE